MMMKTLGSFKLPLRRDFVITWSPRSMIRAKLSPLMIKKRPCAPKIPIWCFSLSNMHPHPHPQLDLLADPFSDREIQDSFLHMNPNASPGPDGFGPSFYRKFWHSLKLIASLGLFQGFSRSPCFGWALQPRPHGSTFKEGYFHLCGRFQTHFTSEWPSQGHCQTPFSQTEASHHVPPMVSVRLKLHIIS